MLSSGTHEPSDAPADVLLIHETTTVVSQELLKVLVRFFDVQGLSVRCRCLDREAASVSVADFQDCKTICLCISDEVSSLISSKVHTQIYLHRAQTN